MEFEIEDAGLIECVEKEDRRGKHMRTINCFLSGMMFLLVCGCGSSAKEQKNTSCALSHQGKTGYVIVQPAGASEAELFASKELSSFLKRITTADFKIVKENELSPGQKGIYVGQSEFAKSQGVRYNELADEEWVIRTTDNGSLVISGGRPRGTLYGVYEFLEKYAGCHWLDEKTEIVPSTPDLAIPSNLEIKDKPDFMIRSIYTYDQFVVNKLNFQLYNARNKCNLHPHQDPSYRYMNADLGFNRVYGKPAPCHTYYFYSKGWPTNHPEYFSLDKNGNRLRAKSSGGPGQVCLSSPEVRKLFIQKLREFIERDRDDARKGGWPSPKVYDISQNDNHENCVCAGCTKIAGKHGAYSGLVLDFINEIADAVRNDYPDVKIQMFAYGLAQDPPKGIKARDNVIIRMALVDAEFGIQQYHRNIMLPLSHKSNEATVALVKDWAQIAKNLSIWDYWILYLDDFPTPYVKAPSAIQADMKWYLENGGHDMFVENEYPESTSFFELKRWFGLKMMQNPNQPVDNLVNVFMAGYYGAAAPVMKEYLDYLQKRIEADGTSIGGVPAVSRKYLDWDFCTRAEDLLDKAEKLVADKPEHLAHVEHERVTVDSILLNKWSIFEKQMPPGKKMPFDKDAVIKRYQKNIFAAIEAYLPPSNWDKLKSEQMAKMEVFKSPVPPLPDEFKNEDCVDLPWLSLRGVARWGMEIVADENAAGHKAAKLGSCHARTKAPNFHAYPVIMGIRDPQKNVTSNILELNKSSLLADGKYHFYKLGRCPIGPSSYLWVHRSWQMQQFLSRAYNPLDPENIYDVYVSLKFQGPAYEKSSSAENAIFMDRIILVKAKR